MKYFQTHRQLSTFTIGDTPFKTKLTSLVDTIDLHGRIYLFMLGRLFYTLVISISTPTVLTHWGLVTPYDDIDLDRNWLR